MAKVVGASSVVLHNDSQVIVEHIKGDYEAKGKWMKTYLNFIKRRTNQAFAAEFILLRLK